MRQVFLIRSGAHTGFTNYTNPFSEYDSGTGWLFVEAAMRVPWNCAGVLRNLGIWRDPAPGTGESITMTLRKNGVDTALVCVLSGTNQTAVASGTDITVSPGDLITISYVTSASPAALNKPEIISIEFEGSVARESGYAIATTGGLTGGGPWYTGIFRGHSNWSNTDGLTDRDVVAVPGSLTGFRASFQTAPGSGNSIVFTVRKNGVDQDGTGGTPDTRLTIADAATSGAVTFNLPLVAGDEVNVKAVPVSGPASDAIGIGISFAATTDGFSQYCGHSSSLLNTGATGYASPVTPDQGGSAWDTTESDVELNHSGATTFQLIGLIVKLGNGPGSGGDAFTFEGRVNGATPSGAPTVTIADAATLGTDTTGAMTVAPGDTLALQASPSVTPSATNANWAWGQFVPTIAGARVTQLLALIVQDRAPDPPVVAPPTGGGTVGAGTDPGAQVDLCRKPVIVQFAEFTPVGGSTIRISKVPLNVTVSDRPLMKSFGDVYRALTSRRGGLLRGSAVTAELVDTTREFRELEATDGLTGGRWDYYLSTDVALKAGTPAPRRVFSGDVTDAEPIGGLLMRLRASGWLQRMLDLDPEPVKPGRLFGLPDFPNMGNDPADPVNPGNPTMLGRSIPVAYGLLSDELKGLNAVGVVPGIFTGVRHIPFFAQDWDEYVLFGHASAGPPLSLFAPIAPFGLVTAPARIKYTPATLPVATDWLTPWHGEWASAFGSANPYLDFNGNRYCLVYGRGPSSSLARTGQVPVVVNIGGAEDVGDGSGNMIESLPLQAAHLLINWFIQTYTSGPWLSAPVINGYSQVNTASFTTVKTRTEARITGGHLGAFLLGGDRDGLTLSELARVLYHHQIYLGENRHGQLMGSAIDPDATPVRTISDKTDTIKGSFRGRRRRDEIRNLIPYRYARLYTPPLAEPTPAVGDALPTSLSRPQPEWDVDDQLIAHSGSQAKYGDREFSLDLELTRDPATADDIAASHLDILAPGPMVAGVTEGICGTNVDLGDNFELNHFEGIDAAGWNGRRLRCEEHLVHMDGDQTAFSVGLDGLDVEDVPVS